MGGGGGDITAQNMYIFSTGAFVLTWCNCKDN